MRFCLDNSPCFKLIELGETASTNTFLSNYQMRQPIDMVVVTAEYQSAGRGQAGNTWESARGCNLLFSIQISPQWLPATNLFSLSEMIALSLRDTVEEILTAETHETGRTVRPHEVTVKWPNVIYVDDKKVAGILIETELQGQIIKRAIIGVGLNINQPHFESDAPNPVSLFQLTGKTLERSFLLASVLGYFNHYYTKSQNGELDALHSAYRQALYRGSAGTFWPFQDVQGEFMARIVDVKPDGHLILEDQSGRLRSYAFKEVAFILQTPTPPVPPKSGRPG